MSLFLIIIIIVIAFVAPVNVTLTLKVLGYITCIHAVDSGIASAVRRHPGPFGNRNRWGSTSNLISIGKSNATKCNSPPLPPWGEHSCGER